MQREAVCLSDPTTQQYCFVEADPLTRAEWRAQSAQCRAAWARKVMEDASLHSLRASILFRKLENRVQTREERHEMESSMDAEKALQRQVMAVDVQRAFDTGEEVLISVSSSYD